MGTALAKTLLKAGHPSTVWNRSVARAEALAGHGANVASSLTEAIAASDLIIICVLDYPAVKELLAPAAPELKGKTIVNFTTGRPNEALAMRDWISGFGGVYIDGALMATPTMVGMPDALIFYSGDETAFHRWQAVLSCLGRTNFLGAEPNLAALMDLSLLSGMYGLFAGFFHAVSLAASGGIPADEMEKLMTPWYRDILGFLGTYATQIREGDYFRDMDANLQVHTTALGNILRASQEQGVRAELLTPLFDLFQARLAAGHGKEDISGIVELMGRASAPVSAQFPS
jgi:3-hydroxyisobutyrate dehydrogenase-like beta-hydroxyacid dehydrogenase